MLIPLFLPEKTLDVLKKMEDNGFLKEIQKARWVLDETEKAFMKTKDYLQKQVGNENL